MIARSLAVAGSLLYIATLVVVPLLNLDRDVLRAHPEDLATANGGVLVVVGWIVFAAALGAVAVIALRERGVRQVVAAVCLALAALVCVANAIDPTLGTRGSAIEYGIFGLVVGPLVASIGSGRRWLTALAFVAAALFLGMVFEAATVGGVVNRAFDALAAVWCVAYAATARERGGGRMRPSGEVA